MKQSVNKGFMFYLAIFVVIIVAIVLVSGAIMLMSPGVKIMGYEYVNSTNTITVETYNGNDTLSNTSSTINYVNSSGEVIEKTEVASFIDFTQLNKLVIKTNGMGVSFRYSGEEDRIDIIRDVKGFAKENTVKKLVATKSYSENVFEITALETTPGLTFSNNSRIIVYFKQHDMSNLNVEIETDTAGINVASYSKIYNTSKELNFNSITFKTKKGNMLLASDATIKSSILIESQENTEVNIKKDQELTGNFKATMKSGRINLLNLTASSMDVIGDSVRVSGKVLKFGVDKGLTLKVKEGDIILTEVAGFVNDIDSLAENLHVKIGKVNGVFIMDKIDIKKANKADVIIDHAASQTLIKTSSGNVKIKNALSFVTIETQGGNIALKNSTSQTILFPITPLYLSQFNLKTDSGNILVNSEHIIKTNTIISNKGNITFNYLNTYDDFEVNAESRSKNAITFNPENKTYSEDIVTGYPTPLDSVKVLANKISLTTNGKITISALKKLEKIA